MNRRKPCAENFYSGDITSQMDQFLADFEPNSPEVEVISGIVPHAGWFFSGQTATNVIAQIALSKPETIVFFGAVHKGLNVYQNSLYGSGAWETPIGDVHIDEDFSGRILEKCNDFLVEESSAHNSEHSLEVQIPMIKHLLPDALIVPIAVPPGPNAPELGHAIGAVARESGRKIAAIGTTDLTHYGEPYGFAPAGNGEMGRKWMVENDQKMIDLIVKLESDLIVESAYENRNACGPGAVAATIEFAKAIGAKEGILVDYTTSYNVMPDNEFSMAVGYAGILFR